MSATDHDEPWGSHAVRQTQQKSNLQRLQTMWLQPPSFSIVALHFGHSCNLYTLNIPNVPKKTGPLFNFATTTINVHKFWPFFHHYNKNCQFWRRLATNDGSIRENIWRIKKTKVMVFITRSTKQSINLASKHWTRTSSWILLLEKFAYRRCSLW